MGGPPALLWTAQVRASRGMDSARRIGLHGRMATIPEQYRDLFTKKAFAHLATVSPDGAPQVTPVWVDFDGTHVRLNTPKGRVKARNLDRHPRGALPIQDP